MVAQVAEALAELPRGHQQLRSVLQHLLSNKLAVLALLLDLLLVLSKLQVNKANSQDCLGRWLLPLRKSLPLWRIEAVAFQDIIS